MQRISDVSFMVLGLMLLVLIEVGGGCSSSAEFEVEYDADSDLCTVILNPPGESGKSNQEGSMKRRKSVSRERGGPFITISNYTVNLIRKFAKSGNVYTITGSIRINEKDDDAKITEYDLTVTGGVYGDSPRRYINEK